MGPTSRYTLRPGAASVIALFKYISAAGVVGSCSGNFTDQTGSIASPNFNIGPYPPSSLCNWTVTVDPGSVLKVGMGLIKCVKNVLSTDAERRKGVAITHGPMRA